MRQAPARSTQATGKAKRSGRSRLLGGASALAAAAAFLLAPHQAAAQVAVGGRAFEANPTGTTGTVTITRTETLDTVRIGSPEAVITWRPIDTATGGGPIDILPTGDAIVFTGDAAFTVLNRVIPDDPSRAIQFNGGVLSVVGGALGGNVWFYSPGGIIAGPTSVFLVGGLVLTSSNLSGIDKAGTELNFLGATAGSRIEVQPGAQLLSGNYLVLWAPRVVQGGGVAAGGNISYVGAEQGRLTVTGGLFDMVINVGTDDPNGVVHTGITTGPTPIDNPVRAITMATVAKNDFVNMLVGGAVGYADASVATAGNGVIVLSAADGTQPSSGNITIGPAIFNSTTLASASGDLIIDLDGQTETLTIGSATNESDFFGFAGRNLTINATSGATVTAFDNFFAQAASPGQGGTLTVNVDDAGRNDDTSFSGLLVGGNLVLSTFGNGVDNIPGVSGTTGGNGVGGTLNINVSQGGELIVGGTTTLSAAGTAGFGTISSGNATGGAINFNLDGNNSRVQLVGNALFDVSGNRSAPGAVNSGGEVTAGNIALALNSGSFTFANLTLAASADADDSIAASGRANGAFGGTIDITNTARITGTTLTANALALGGGGGASATSSDAGGDGSGGSVTLTNGVGGSLTLQALGIDVSGSGGEGASGALLVNGARGGSGFGGDITLSNAGTLAGNPTVTLGAAGGGGNGGAGGPSLDDFNPGADGGAAGGGIGGTINVVANGAATAFRINSLINAGGIGGTGGAGGDARFFESGNGGLGGFGQGGDISLESTTGGSLTITAGTGTLTLGTSGTGGAGGDEGFGLNPVGNPGQNGGSAGGTIDVLASGGALTINGNLVADASAAGNLDFRDGATGADATGGTITTNTSGGGALTIGGGLWLDASALAAIGNVSAGTGQGGTANMLMSGAGSSFAIQGVFPIAGFPRGPQTRSLYVDTSAYEPQSGSPLLQTASGGATLGGAVNITFTGGQSTIAGQSQVIASAGRENPNGGISPAPNLLPGTGDATGGSISITLVDSTHQWNSFDATLETYAPGATANDGTIRVLLDNATLDAGVGFSFSTTTFGDAITNTADVIAMRLTNGSSLTTSGFTAFYTEAVLEGLSSTPVASGNILLELDDSTISSDIFYTSIVPGGTGNVGTGGTMGLFARNGSVITGDVEINIFASGGAGAGGSASRSGDINYLLDGSSHTGDLFFYSFGEGIGGVNSGDPGGEANGGNQNLSIINGSSFTGDMTLATFLDSYYDTTSSGALGDVDGGSFTLVIDGSTVDIGVLDVSYNGGADTAADGVAGANVAATDFSLLVTGSQVSIGDAIIALDATGGRGGDFGIGGNGIGGDILVTSDATSSLTINDASFSSRGTGGVGGNGVSSGSGAAGGMGLGGAIGLFSLGDLEINSLFAAATGRGGNGGSGAADSSGGTGGQGQGGSVELEVSAAVGVTLTLGPVALDSSATGGTGGFGGNGGGPLVGGLGGTGGNGTGGTTRFRLTGSGADLAFSTADFTMTSIGTGGIGGEGGPNFSGLDAGAGGTGGDGTGGTVAVESGSGARLELQGPLGSAFVLGVDGIGGTGGRGGGIDFGGGNTGNGGQGGNGTGGSPVIRAAGGEIVASQVNLSATGIGGQGGAPGGFISTAGVVGNGGVGTGGSPLLETLDGSPGILTLGTVVIDASGIAGGGTISGSTAGGQITITDASADPAGLITIGTLTVTANGPLTPPGTPSLTIEGDSGPITVTDAVNATVAGDINFVFGGNGQLVVGGTANLDAGGDITLTHTGNAGALPSLDIGTDLIATAGGDFIGGVGSIIDAGRDVSINAQNIQFASIAAVRDLLLTATTGDITGVGLADLVAGRVLDLDAAQAIAIGDAESDLSIALTAGTSVTTGNLTSVGADTIGDERIDIVAGGDVSLGVVDAIDALTITGAGLSATSLDGQSVTATMTGAIDIGTATSETTIALSGASIVLDNGDAPGNITLTAGSGAIALGTINSETNLTATADGDISFAALTGLVVSLNAGGGITGGTAAADRNIVSGVSRNVNLTAVGDISIDSASAIADVVVRGASFAATSVSSGTGLNDDIDVLVGGLVDIGSTNSGGQTVLTGSAITLGSGVAGAGASVLTSTVGDVSLGTFDSENFLDIVSAGSVDFDTLTARALSIDAQSNVIGTRAATDVNLISGRPRNVTITATNSVSVDELAAIDNVIIDAFTLNTLDVTAQGNLLATLVGVGNLTSINTGGSATVTGSSLAIGDGVSGGLALLTATVGDVDLGTWDAQGFFDIDAVGSVNFDSVTGLLVEVIAGGDITGNFAASDINQISGRPRNVTLDAGGAVSIGEARSIGNVLLDGTSVDAGIVNAATIVTVTATGAAAVDSLTAGTNATVRGASVALIDGTAGGFLRGNATAGDLGVTGTFSVTGAIDLDATGNIAFGTLASSTGVLDARAGGDITFTSASSPVNVTLIAGGLISGGVISGRDAVVTGGSVDIDDVSMTGLVTLTSTVGDLLAGNVSSTNVSVTATSAGALSLADVTAGANIVLGSAGDTNVGNVNAGSQVTFNTSGNLVALDVVGSGPTPGLDINVGGDAQLGSVTSGGLLDIDVGGDLTGDVFDAAGSLTVDAASIAITSANSDVFGVVLRSTVGGVSADLLTAAGSVQVASATGATLGSLDAGANIDVTAVGNTALGDATAGGNLTVTITGNLASGALAAGATPSSILDLNVTGDAQVASAQSGFILDVDVGGALTGGNFASGATTVDAASIDVTRVAGTAGGGVIVNATTGDAAIGTVDSGGNARINALAGAANIDTLNAALLGEVIGRSVTVNSGTIGGNLRLQATAGDVAGTGEIDVAGAIDLDATGDIGFGTLAARGGAFTGDAGGAITYTGATARDTLAFNAGGAVSGGDLAASIISVSSGADADLGGLSANGTITVGAAGALTAGDIATIVSGANNSIALTSGGAMTLGDVTSGESLSMIAGGALSLGTATTVNSDSTSTILARGTGVTANLLATQLNSGAGVTVDARTGLADIGRIEAGAASSVTGGSIALDSAEVRGNLRLLATNGGIVSSGLLDVRGASDFDATGAISLATLLGRAQIAIDTPGLLSFDRIANVSNGGGTIRLAAGTIQGGDLGTNVSGANDSIFVTTAGAATLGTITSGEGITLNAVGAVVLGSASTLNSDAASFIAITGATVDAGSLATMTNSGADVDVTATSGLASVGTVISGGDTTVTGAAVALDSGDIRGNLALTATAGDIDGTGAILVARGIALSATGNVGFGSLTARGGSFTVDAGNDIAFTGASSSDFITMTAGGAISGGDLDATNALSLAGASIAIGDAAGATIALTSDTDIRFNLLQSTNAIDVIANNGDVGSNGGAGDIDSGGAVTVLGNAVNLGTINAGASVSATAVLGDLGFESILASGDVDFSAAGDAFVDHLETTGSFAATTGGNFATGPNSIITGGDIVINAGLLVDLGASSAGGLIDVTGQQIDFTTLVAGTSVDLTTVINATAGIVGNGNITGTGVDAGGAITITAVGSTNITGAATAGTSLTVGSAGASQVAFAGSGTDTSIAGQSVLVNDALVGGDLLLDAFNGAINGSGNGDVGGSIAMSATGDVTFGAFSAQSGNFTVDAGGNVTFSGASAGGSIDMIAPGAINGGDLLAGGALTLDGGLIAIGDASATNIALTSATDILFNLLTSPNAISLTATNGVIAANTGAGDIDSGGDVTLTAQAIALNDVTSLGTVGATATTGDASFATVDAAGNITISAAGTPTVANAISGGDTSITGQSVTFSNGTIGGDLSLTATGGDIDGNGTISVGGGIALDATGNIAFGSLDAQGGALTANAGGDIAFTSASALGQADLKAGGSIQGGDLSGASVSATATGDAVVANVTSSGATQIAAGGLAAFDSITGTLAVTINGGTIAGGDVATPFAAGDNSISLNSAGDLAVGNVTSGENTSLIAGGAVTAGAIRSLATDGATILVQGTGVTASEVATPFAGGGGIVVDGGAGAVDIGSMSAGSASSVAGASLALGAVDVRGSLGLLATNGSILATSGLSASGQIDVDATGDIALGSVTGGNRTLLDAGGTVTFDTIASALSVVINAATIAGGDISTPFAAGDNSISLATTGDMALGDVTSGEAVSLIAGGAISAGTISSIATDGSTISIDSEGLTIAALVTPVSGGGIIVADGGSGSVDLGSVVSGSDATISGASVTLGTGDVRGNLSLAATTGDIDVTGVVSVARGIALTAAGDARFGILEAQGGAFIADAGGDIAFAGAASSDRIALTAGGVIDGGDLSAPNAIALEAGRIVIGSAVGGSLSLLSSTDVLFDVLASPNAISVTASTGVVGGNTGAGSIDSGDDVTLQAVGIDLGSIIAGGTIDVAVSGTSLSLGTLDAADDIVLDSAGSIVVDHAEAGGNFTATAGLDFATGPNSILTGGDIVIDADGPVTLGNSSAGGLVDVTGSQIDFSTLAAGQTVMLLTEPSRQPGFGNGNITGTDLTAGAGGSSINSTFGSVSIGGQTTVGGSLTVGADGDITLGTVAVQGGDLAATAGGSIALGAASASGNAGLTAGGSITATGDIAAGRALTLLAQTGVIAARDLIASGVNASAATGLTLRDVVLSGGGVSLVSGGDATLRDVTGAGASGVSITADGSLGFDDIVTSGGVSLLAENGALTGTSVTSGGAVSLDGESVALGSVAASGDVFGIGENGAFVAGSITSSAGEVFLESATLIDVDTIAAATDITVQGGDIDLGNADAGGGIALTSGAANGIVAGPLAAGGSITANAGSGGFAGVGIASGGDTLIESGAGISFDQLSAGGAVSLVSTGTGDIAGAGIDAGTSVAASTAGSFAADTVSAGGVINLSADSGISLSRLVGSTAQLAASGGEVRVTVEIDVPGLVDASGQSVFLRSTRNLAVSATATAGGIDIQTDRDLDVTGAEATGGNISLVSTGGVATVSGVNAMLPASGTAAGGNVYIEAGENLDVAGAVTAANGIEIRSGERASIDAAVVGSDIVLHASDVAISDTGSLGTLADTRSIEISGGGIARIGGEDGSTPGFIIDNDEFSRIRSGGSIAISASTAIILDDLNIRVANGSSADGNLRGEGRIDFSAAEGIDVIGEVVMTGATADNAIGLSTGGDVFLDASTGLLEINDGSGKYLGLIEVVATNFHAMTEQALADIQNLTSIEAIDDRLAQNDGIDNPDGLIRTGTLDISTTDSNVFIQNTAPGTRFEERRGFTVDELLIADPGGTNQPIVINGIIAGATGVDAVPLAQITSSFDPGSTINGCLIANPAGCIQIPENLGEGTFPVQDLIEEELDEDEAGEPGLESGVLETPLFELKDAQDSSEDPLLDDPVTGAGNEDLWVGGQPQG